MKIALTDYNTGDSTERQGSKEELTRWLWGFFPWAIGEDLQETCHNLNDWGLRAQLYDDNGAVLVEGDPEAEIYEHHELPDEEFSDIMELDVNKLKPFETDPDLEYEDPWSREADEDPEGT